MPEAGFMDGQRGACFHVLHTPNREPVRGVVLYVHPFAEEMNKARRMAALQARRLAAEGFAVLLPDHFGCGDSQGDFSDASWDTWLSDLCDAVAWLRGRYAGPLTLWGLRTGCLLISGMLTRGEVSPDRCVLWQPVTRGELFLNQFLRLRVAAGMMSGNKESAADLRRILSEGGPVEVAGYGLSAEIVEPLAQATLEAPSVPVHWLEVGMGDAAGLPPASQRVVDAWRQAGVSVDTAVVAGEPFWTTQEIREVPELLERTTRCLTGI